jgi:hypothetical protein
MTTTTKQSWMKRLGTIFAAAALVAAVMPFDAVARPVAPARCGRNGDFGGGIKVSGCVIDECVRKGGLIEIHDGRPNCCVSSGYGEDQVTVCEEVDQLIDLIVTPLPSTRVWSPRPFGAVSRFAR